MQKTILKTDGIFLLVMGAFAGITDLIAYFTGNGPFGTVYFQNSIAIGGFEAHCLAAAAGFVFITKSKSADAAFFNKVAVFIHTALGVSNIIWWKVFLDTNTLPVGYITTFAHFTFVLFNSIAIFKTKHYNVTAN